MFVCFLKVLSSLSLHHVRQAAVSNLCSRTSSRLSQHENIFFVAYLGNEISLSVYLSVIDSFFLWGSQRKRLSYVDAIFVSVVATMLYILSLLTRFIPTKPMVVIQLPLSMNRWIPFFRSANDNICLFNKRPWGCLLSYQFCFRRYFKKSGHKPHFAAVTNQCLALEIFYAIYSLWVLSWSFSPTSPSGAFVKLSSVTSTSCRSDHYPIFRKLYLQKATMKVLQPPLASLYLCTHPLLTFIMRSKCNLIRFWSFIKSFW